MPEPCTFRVRLVPSEIQISECVDVVVDISSVSLRTEHHIPWPWINFSSNDICVFSLPYTVEKQHKKYCRVRYTSEQCTDTLYLIISFWFWLHVFAAEQIFCFYFMFIWMLWRFFLSFHLQRAMCNDAVDLFYWNGMRAACTPSNTLQFTSFFALIFHQANFSLCSAICFGIFSDIRFSFFFCKFNKIKHSK